MVRMNASGVLFQTQRVWHARKSSTVFSDSNNHETVFPPGMLTVPKTYPHGKERKKPWIHDKHGVTAKISWKMYQFAVINPICGTLHTLSRSLSPSRKDNTTQPSNRAICLPYLQRKTVIFFLTYIYSTFHHFHYGQHSHFFQYMIKCECCP